ncbi:hypothetical protein PGT21_006928 [Puccinia graminis f. sp. tritici]|uniref:Protein kinase domain-containing protein n=1 Tax=Puccinia graminis f. sp. tritici TaxID=56615 RepID=A0A5B0Q2C9_PUCGR|nr:hypothetical protein PGT21_006928 [Puccinia graminis f. sp. tritici]
MTLDSIQKHLQHTTAQLHQLIIRAQQQQQDILNNNNNKKKAVQAQWPPDEWFNHTKTARTTADNQPPPPPITNSLSLPSTQSTTTTTTTTTQSTNSIILNDSPCNTQSISPNITPIINQPSSSPKTTKQPPPPPPQQTVTTTTTTFRPPPPHPSRLDHSKSIGVKETLDAHSSFSEFGQKQVNQYLIKHEIGRGSFGAVQLAEDAQTGLSYAIKELSKTRLKRKFARELRAINHPFLENNHHHQQTRYQHQQQQVDALFLIRNEVAIMKKIRHQNLVRLYEVLDVEGEDSLYMVMEYCPGGSLMRLVQETRQQKLAQLGLLDHHYLEERKGEGDLLSGAVGLDLDLARKYFRQLVLGIDYLHRNEIIHYDIKPDNLLLSSDKKQLKVVDFGISAMFVKPGDDSTVSRTIGSPAFLSPELIRAAQSDLPVSGTAADIWAMGVTLYFMLTGALPFPSDQMMAMYEAIETKAPAIPDEWDGPLIDLMSRILDKQPSSRIKMSELREQEWVTNGGKLAGLSPTIIHTSSRSSLKTSNPNPDPTRSLKDEEKEQDDDDEKGDRTTKVTETDLKESFRFGFTNRCPVFSELVDNALKLSSWIPLSSSYCSPSSSSSSSNQPLLGRRKELFFKPDIPPQT